MNPIYKSSSNFTSSFNNDSKIKELSEKFGRLIKQTGSNNKKGSSRYDYEVDFAYALNDVKFCPRYSQDKAFDKVNNIINSLINDLKTPQSEESAETV